MVKIHEKYIKRCIEIAKNGLGTTCPNPLVGSVVVHEDTIIGEGWHKVAGAPHAEVLAITSVNEKQLLKDSTIYINLEPCSHYGKTPPCSDLIIASGIKNVVVGMVDPFAEVAGRGIQKLREAGCTVTVGVLEAVCKRLNKRFFTFHTKKRPYIILKWAESADGFLASDNTVKDIKQATPEWISNVYSRQRVHQWRSEEQAILVGTTTVLQDNPKLNVRDWNGNAPVRVVLDRKLRIPKAYSVWDDSVKTVFISDEKYRFPATAKTINEHIDFSGNIAQQICDILYKHGLQSLIVEGGAQTLQTFIGENLWDDVRVFKGVATLKKGIKTPKFNAVPIDKENIAGDVLSCYENSSYKN